MLWSEGGCDAVDEARDSNRGREQSDPTKILLTVSLKALYITGSALIGVCWFIIRLWMGGFEDELRARHTAQIAEETARLRDVASLHERITKLEHEHIEFKSLHGNYDRGFDATWKKFDRLEDDRWNNRKR